MPLSQVQAVVNAVADVLGDSFVPSTTIVKDVLTADQKKEVREIVKQGILNGDVAYKGDTENNEKFNRYVNGMINNHLIRSKKLNGGNVHKPKTQRDDQLNEMSKLLNTLTPGTNQYDQVAEAISKRKQELSQKTVVSRSSDIDTSIAPSEISSIVSQFQQ